MTEENNNLPEAVKKQAEEARKIQEEVYGPSDQEGSSSGEVNEPGQKTHAGTPEDPGFDDAGHQKAESKEHSQGSAPEDKQEEDWEKRFRHYKGQTDYKLFQERQANQQLQSQIGQLQSQLNEAMMALDNVRSTQRADPRTFLPEDLVESLGEDTAADVAAVAEQVTRNVSSRYERTINQMANELNQMKGERMVSKKLDTVNSLLSVVGEINSMDFNTVLGIDQNAGFHNWLHSNRDPFSGRTFMDLYHVAGNAGDAHRVADFQRQWFAATQPQGRGNPFEQKVTPDRTKGSTRVPTQDKSNRLWTGVEIQQFYQDKLRRKYSEEEAARLEQDIFAAQREGRIVDRKSNIGRAM